MNCHLLCFRYHVFLYVIHLRWWDLKQCVNDTVCLAGCKSCNIMTSFFCIYEVFQQQTKQTLNKIYLLDVGNTILLKSAAHCQCIKQKDIFAACYINLPLIITWSHNTRKQEPTYKTKQYNAQNNTIIIAADAYFTSEQIHVFSCNMYYVANMGGRKLLQPFLHGQRSEYFPKRNWMSGTVISIELMQYNDIMILHYNTLYNQYCI